MKISIVADSTCDIPDNLVKQFDIHVVPNLVMIEGKSLRDGIDISRQEFYERLPGMKSPPTTATASSGAYQQLYGELFEQGADEIVSIHVASKLSGVFNAASLGGQPFGERVHVIDSGALTMGFGFQVLAAAEEAAKGHEIGAVIQAVDQARRGARVFAMLDTLEYIRRSGRVSWARARLGNLLQIKPFIQVKDGQVYSMGEVRTRNKGVARLRQFLDEVGNVQRLAILHTNAESDAQQFLNKLEPDLPDEPFIVNVTTAIGVHVGPNGLGFAAIVA